jgi:hypothetical protein
MREFCRTIRPENFDPPQPSAESLAEALISRVVGSSQLGLQSVGTEQRYPGDLVLQSPALPDNPDIEIQQTWSIS